MRSVLQRTAASIISLINVGNRVHPARDFLVICVRLRDVRSSFGMCKSKGRGSVCFQSPYQYVICICTGSALPRRESDRLSIPFIYTGSNLFSTRTLISRACQDSSALFRPAFAFLAQMHCTSDQRKGVAGHTHHVPAYNSVEISCRSHLTVIAYCMKLETIKTKETSPIIQFSTRLLEVLSCRGNHDACTFRMSLEPSAS